MTSSQDHRQSRCKINLSRDFKIRPVSCFVFFFGVRTALFEDFSSQLSTIETLTLQASIAEYAKIAAQNDTQRSLIDSFGKRSFLPSLASQVMTIYPPTLPASQVLDQASYSDVLDFFNVNDIEQAGIGVWWGKVTPDAAGEHLRTSEIYENLPLWTLVRVGPSDCQGSLIAVNSRSIILE
eukprot:TRINITY_DN14325_c0_g1_i1.p1 TRINITY_DN14325_c0_g1~~TRINITY_DN14325_c0_g1_i1.p1  ORF type:complete len:181 (+),score=26.54 TRINITY_DN14325_c0_g1_i1:383-925(+)